MHDKSAVYLLLCDVMEEPALRAGRLGTLNPSGRRNRDIDEWQLLEEERPRRCLRRAQEVAWSFLPTLC